MNTSTSLGVSQGTGKKNPALNLAKASIVGAGLGINASLITDNGETKPALIHGSKQWVFGRGGFRN
ncbi:hypothetical protein MC7420_6938 [Coleofasciculus chthonoplastes PCC 7420]|uniref:Uncharacterized protein n=1 Tax=Coleofasciculus chthonoplastes PCC 7420 TaxID=118168 RepID=B4W1Q6_9CYAN|nr:hypothetical protein [Coleofasciculus chthonoplastes]EDX71852.1 hypothetical protein MC7420_6938 [Coleofasciculus chthonoplastes PCC 7420]